jgi:Zn-dependent protease
VSRTGALAVQRTRAVGWSPSAEATCEPSFVRLTRVAIQADLSYAFGIVLTAWTFSAGFLPETDPGHSLAAYWTAGIAGALGVTASLLIHELGHVIAARRAGLGVSGIRLSFAGGASQITGIVRHPRSEFAIAAAGPFATTLVMLAAAVLHVALVEAAAPSLAATTAALVAVANLAVLVLNLVPALPLDGGRMLRSLVWASTRKPRTATQVAITLGRWLGDAMIAVAVLASAFGFVWIALWAAFLGFVVRDGG